MEEALDVPDSEMPSSASGRRQVEHPVPIDRPHPDDIPEVVLVGSVLGGRDDVGGTALCRAVERYRNHHVYWDRDYPRGRTFWTVNRGDDPDLPDVGRDIDRE